MRQEALPQGLLPMHGEGFNGNTTPTEVAMTTAIYNEPRELEKRFFGKENPGTLLELPFEDGSEIRLHNATGKYSPHHLLLAAHGPDFSSLPKDEPIKTETLYQYPRDVQKQYWNLLLTGTKAYKEILGDEYRVFATGNWVNNYSNFDERTARTIGLPHDHICAIKKDTIRPYVDGGLETISGYKDEIEITKKLLPTGLKRIQSDFTDLSLTPRTEAPTGYSFIIPAETDFDTFTDIMRNHHDAYTNSSHKIKTIFDKRGKNSLSQPSYQLYIELDDEYNRHVSISPSFGGAMGALESAGIQLKRDKSYPHLVDPEIVRDTQQAVGIQVANSLSKQQIKHRLYTRV